MLIAFICIFIAGFLPLVWIAYAKISAGFQREHNDSPREFMDKSSGSARRALNAEKNALESFPLFTAGVFVAIFCRVDEVSLSVISILFVTVRVLHGITYILNKQKLRTFVWFIGIGCVSTLFLLSFISYGR